MSFEIRTINIAIELFGILICTAILLCRNFLVGSQQQKLRTIFTSLVFCEILLLFAGAVYGILTGISTYPVRGPVTAAVFLRLFFVYILLGLFTEYVSCYFQFSRIRTIRLCTWGLIALSTAALIANLFRPFYYSVDPSGVFEESAFFQFSQFPCVLICLENFVFVFFRKRDISRVTFISFLLYILLPVAALFVQLFFFQLDLINIAMIIVMLYMFVTMQNRIVSEYIEQKKQLQESQARLMMSQIKPHFLFNALTSIAQLCDDDPQQARSTTIAFANYLRGNLASIEKTEPIPFSEELSHIRSYLKIECTRFGDLLRVVYDVETEDFRVPVLSIQPLIENAVKHGVGMKEDGGTVTLSVHRADDGIVLSILDDGVGFDPADKLSASSAGIGIRNSAERLKTMCRADMRISSSPGAGTTVTIHFPKREDDEHDDLHNR